MLIYGVFDVRQPERCRYVGLTARNAEKRSKEHWRDSERGNLPFHRFLRKRKLTPEVVEFRILEWADDRPHLENLERFWIAQYREIGMADLNVCSGGDGASGNKLSAEHVNKLARLSRERWADPEYRELRISEIRERASSPQSREAMSLRAKKMWEAGVIKGRPGEANGRNILKDVDIPRIKKQSASGQSYASIAREYGVSPCSISNVVRGITWRHLND